MTKYFLISGTVIALQLLGGIQCNAYNTFMTSKDLQAELTKDPFVPLRLHLVSGKTIDVPSAGIAWMMQNTVLIFQDATPSRMQAKGYDVIAFRNIERISKPRKAG